MSPGIRRDYTIRCAKRGDVVHFVDMVMSLDDPTLLLGPRYQDNPDQPHPAEINQYYFSAAFRSPLGQLGYRRTVVAETEGQIAGFIICVPFDLLKDELLGKMLPQSIISEHYGENLSSVLNLYFLCVDRLHRGHQLPLKLISYCLKKCLS